LRYPAPVEADHRDSAARMRAQIERGPLNPGQFRAALMAVAPIARDAWVDVALGLGEPPQDGPDLPRGCVPYLPCGIDALLRLVAHAPVRPSDVFVDIGAGVGERSGQLETMLENVATAYERDVEVKVGQLTALLSPLMIVIMGIAVGFMVFSILGPIMDMQNLVQ
jgi:hypothetical protein